MANHKGFGLARERESKAMDVLADVVLGLIPLNPSQLPEDPRQLGYLATLAKGATYDTSNRLLALAKMCRDSVSSSEVGTESARNTVDMVHRSWGAAWHMDASKLRRELPLHVVKKQRSMSSSSKPSVEFA